MQCIRIPTVVTVYGMIIDLRLPAMGNCKAQRTANWYWICYNGW